MIFNESLSLNKIVAVVLIVSGLGVGLYGQHVLSAVLKVFFRICIDGLVIGVNDNERYRRPFCLRL